MALGQGALSYDLYGAQQSIFRKNWIFSGRWHLVKQFAEDKCVCSLGNTVENCALAAFFLHCSKHGNAFACQWMPTVGSCWPVESCLSITFTCEAEKLLGRGSFCKGGWCESVWAVSDRLCLWQEPREVMISEGWNYLPIRVLGMWASN